VAFGRVAPMRSGVRTDKRLRRARPTSLRASRPSRTERAGSGVSVPTYRVHDHAGDDLGVIQHPAPNLEPGDIVVLPGGREALVTARVEAEPGPLAALLEVVVAPPPGSEAGNPLG
jgi:hypothetical protein